MSDPIRIGTRESQLALWQANEVKRQLQTLGYASELVPIKSEGDIDLVTPLYEMGVQGIFTRSLDAALLNNKIDIAVHSMKDVPVQLPKGIVQAAVLKRASYKDLLVYKKDISFLNDPQSHAVIATSSIRRKAQWLHQYPNHTIVNLRGNVNTRLKKVEENDWDGAIFAAAGLERINLRPEKSLELDWMLPAPAQGAIMVVCRGNDAQVLDACSLMNDATTALCTKMEREFLHALMGGCTTPISGLAIKEADKILFHGSICSDDGKEKKETKKIFIDTRSFIQTQETVDEALAMQIRSMATQKLNVVITSKNAERIIKKYAGANQHWDIFSITNQPDVKNASQLADVIIDKGVQEVVFFCGNKRREELPQKLAANGIRVQEIVVYQTVETPHTIEGQYHGVVFFSPSAVKSFFSSNTPSPDVICFTMGDTTANEIKKYSSNRIETGDFKKGIL